MKRFFVARSGQKQCDLSQLVKSFADQLLKLLNKATLGPGDVPIIMEELKDDNPYGEYSDVIQTALDKYMLSGDHQDESESANQSATKQILQNWWSYPTADEWAIVLCPNKAVHVKMITFVHRARMLGIVNPDEQTIKWMLALIYKCHYKELPPAKQRFRQLNELKMLFITEQESRPDMVCPLPLRSYPQKACDLPGSIFRAAYPADSKPIDKSDEMTGLAAIAKLIPLRRISNLLKGVVWDDDDDLPAPKKVRTSCKTEPSTPVKAEQTAKIEPITSAPGAFFCHACGHELNAAEASPHHHCHAVKKEEPEEDTQIHIRQQLRLNGQPVAPSVPVLHFDDQKHEADKNTEPRLDKYAQAAVDALKTRNEKKADATKAKRAAGITDSQPAAGVNDLEPEPDDEADDDDDDPALRKPSGAPRKRPASAIAVKLKAPVFRPSYALEESRQQVQCRTGLKASLAGGVISPCFKYKNFSNGKTGAVKAAKKWLADFRKNHKCK